MTGEQDSIQSSPLGRMAVLAGTGAKVGINYLKHYGRSALSGKSDTTILHEENASDVYASFSKLKGGPLKLAQMLSIDRNLLPPAYAKQFAQAQYSAPPLSYPLVVRTFRREFQREPLEIFDTFTRSARHGASIGQVHRAEKNGHAYAVKVQYPGVAESLKSDLRVVKPLALQILGLREKDVAQYFTEVETRLLEETDYRLELRRSMELSAASAHIENLGFPRYYPEFSGARVLTMDWIDGQPLDLFAAGNPTQEERDVIGQALWDFYHHQIHELRLFHADPHPGNFLVSEGRLVVLDFGCTKAIDAEFYKKQFQFLDPKMVDDAGALELALDMMGILLPEDLPEERHAIRHVVKKSIDLLASPFREELFDFGSASFMDQIYQLGFENKENPALKSARGPRGSAESVYVNRAYFGLYSLLSMLGSRVRTSLPDWLKEPAKALHETDDAAH